MGDEDDWNKLPSDQKVAHKNWKARVAGYTELVKAFGLADEKSPEFLKYGPQIKGFISDSNAAAQEKGLEAAIAFLNSAPQNVISKCAQEVISVAVTKGLAAMKPKTKESAQEIVMLFIEKEKNEAVMEEFATALENKQPKFVATCALVLRDALKAFGPKVVNIKSVLKAAPKLLEDRDPAVRDAGKQLVLEMATWVGRAAIKPHLQSLKPVQISELDAEFDKLEAQRVQPVPTRFTITEQKKRMAAGYVADVPAVAGTSAVAGPASAVAEVKTMDAWELADPEEIISKFPSDWKEKLESKKWQERKEALEPFEKLTSAIRLKPGEYGDLCHSLINVIKKDANIVVVQLAAKVVFGLAKGLRKNFSPYAHACLEVLLERSKEKKQNLLQQFREAVDAIFVSTNLEAMAEHILPYLSNKTPIVRQETAAFLDRCFTASRGPKLFGSKKIVKLYVPPLLILAGDQAGEVREAAFETLGCLHAFAGEKTVQPLLADVEPIRLAKIHEVSKKRMETIQAGAAPAATTAPPPESSKPASAPVAPKKAVVTKPTASYEDNVDNAPVPAVKKAPIKSAPAGGRKAPAKESKKGFEESEMSEDTAIYEIQNLFGGEEFTKKLQSSNWKERQEACEQILSQIRSMSADSVPVQAIIRALAVKSGLRDNNVPVMKLKLDIIAALASEKCGHRFSKMSGYACLNELVDKIGDVKNGPIVQKILTDMADFCDACGPEFLIPYVLSQGMSSKSPKTHQESLTWVGNMITEFGLRFSLKDLVPLIRQGLASANGQVRTAAIATFGRLYMLTGATLRTLLDDEKPALLQMIDAEFERVKDQPAPRPTRGIRGKGQQDDDVDVGEDAAPAATEAALEDLLPRVDISAKLAGELMEQLDDKTSYKIRKEAIDKVIDIIKEAKLIHPALGDLPSILVKRLKEANKVLVQSALTVCEQLASSMGKKIAEHISVLAPAILVSFGDGKPQIRQQAAACLGVWVDQCGSLNPFCENLIFSGALQAGNPNSRGELLLWLSKRLPPKSCKLPKDDLITALPIVLASLEDRSAEIRKSAQEAVLPIMIHTGYEPFAKAVEALKPASRDQLAPLIDKAKSELPPPPSRAAPAASSTMVKRPATSKPDAPVKAAPQAEPPRSSASPVERRPSSPKSVSKSVGSPLAKGRAQSAVNLKDSPVPAVSQSAIIAPPEPEVALFDEKISTPAAKDARYREESKLKLLKWNFSQPSKEYLDQLRKQVTTANFSPILVETLFASDVRQHIRAIDQIAAYAERKPVVVFSNIDLIFKWLTLRFFDNNTTLHIRCFRFLICLLPLFGANKLRLSDSDVACFLPYLLVKVGDPKDNIRRDVHQIVRAMCDVYPVHKLVPWIIDGLKSKNAKQRAECLEQLQTFFTDFDMATVGCDQPALISLLRSMASQVADRDASVRNAALSCLVVAAQRQGFGADGILQHTAQVMQPKERAMLEERLRRACPGGASFDSEPSIAPGTAVKSAQSLGTPNVAPIMSGTATMTRPSRAVATPVSHSLDSRGSGVISTPGTSGMQIAANAGAKTITRRNSSTTRPAPRVVQGTLQSSSIEPTTVTPELLPSSVGSPASNASPSPVRTSISQSLSQPLAPTSRFTDPIGQNWASPNLPADLPPFTAASEFLNEPPFPLPHRSVDPNTLPASNSMVPTILARLNSGATPLTSPEISTALTHLSLTATNRRINLEPHCNEVVSTLTLLLRRVCDVLSPQSKVDLYRVEPNYFQTLSHIGENLEDLHSKLFQVKSPFAQKVGRDILHKHLALLTNEISSLNTHVEQKKSLIESWNPSSNEAVNFEAQKAFLQRLVAILKSVIRSANAGTLLVVLIELLQECVQMEKSTNNGNKDLILKALWNITRHIDERHVEIDNSSCNWEAIVGSAHRFFVTFPPTFWATTDTVPARTVRTIFNAAIVHLGLGKHILSCYEKIYPDNYSQSHLYGWLLNCLQKHNASNNMNGSAHSDGHNGAASASSSKENGIGMISSARVPAIENMN